jgi:hypothetical protein
LIVDDGLLVFVIFCFNNNPWAFTVAVQYESIFDESELIAVKQ